MPDEFLWRCPTCERVFANRNQTHTCAGLHDLAHTSPDASRFSPRNHVHTFRLEHPSDIDGTFIDWMREAYAVGEHRHLTR
jgi:hypothetical protein